MKLWSKLQKELYDLISDDIHFQIHCAAYRMQSNYGSTNLPRYWITLGKDIIWDYPKHFIQEGKLINTKGETFDYPYVQEVSQISEIIRDYIDTPKDQLFDKQFELDNWNLTPILKAADRRIGKRRLQVLQENSTFEVVVNIITQRLKNNL